VQKLGIEVGGRGGRMGCAFNRATATPRQSGGPRNEMQRGTQPCVTAHRHDDAVLAIRKDVVLRGLGRERMHGVLLRCARLERKEIPRTKKATGRFRAQTFYTVMIPSVRQAAERLNGDLPRRLQQDKPAYLKVRQKPQNT
jgi:hypothetical protein